jgi:Thoeris protein ThsB, TIR-like domain
LAAQSARNLPRFSSASGERIARREDPSRLFPIFRDREELPVSADLGSNINEALQESRYLIVICSPRAAQSRWVAEEIKTFEKRLTLIAQAIPLTNDPALIESSIITVQALTLGLRAVHTAIAQITAETRLTLTPIPFRTQHPNCLNNSTRNC